MARAKQRPLGEWQINKIGKVARYVGKVQATDAEAAIERAIEKFDIRPEQRGGIAARPIVVG